MKKTKFDLSDNLYYADQIGTIEEQIQFLDSLHFTEPQLSYDHDTFQEIFYCVAHVVSGSSIVSRLVTFFPSMPPSLCDKGVDFHDITPWPRMFNTSKVLDIKAYLKSHGYSPKYAIINYVKLCEEDLSGAVADTAVAEDAASELPTEDLECGN